VIGLLFDPREDDRMPPVRRLDVLIVDDDPAIREALAAGLARDYSVHAAATGDEACAILAAHPIAVIILDAFLGQEHGLDLVARFRAIAPVPILVLTGYSTEDLAIKALRAQVADYLKKPVELPLLLERVARLTGTAAAPDPVQHALDHLARDPAAHPTMEAIADHVGLSERQLRRKFATQTGMPPAHYAIEVRLERAAHLLATTRLPINRIARRVGYKDRHQFTRVFRRKFGVTPTAYRVHPRCGSITQPNPSFPGMAEKPPEAS